MEYRHICPMDWRYDQHTNNPVQFYESSVQLPADCQNGRWDCNQTKVIPWSQSSGICHSQGLVWLGMGAGLAKPQHHKSSLGDLIFMVDGNPFTFSRIKDPHRSTRITKLVKMQKTQKEKYLNKIKKDVEVKTAKGMVVTTCQIYEKPNPQMRTFATITEVNFT